MKNTTINKKITLMLVTVLLLACNALLPRTSRPSSEPVIPRQTDSVYAQGSAPAGFTLVRLHPKDGDLQNLLAEEAQKAMALDQMPVIEFDATWCGACQAIDKGLKAENELMLKAYAGTYIIKLDVDEWGWGDSRLHNFDFDGIPVYFKLDGQGQPTGEVIDGNAWGDNIPENIAPPMDEFFHGK
jgi:thiol:disulfide interchange protein